MKKAERPVRTGGRISKEMYWCVQYLTTVVKEDQTGILLGALSLGVERARNNIHLKKPTTVSNKNGRRVDLRIPKKLYQSMTMVRIEKELYDWGMIDFLRYGLEESLRRYTYRYPELYRVTKRYENEDSNDNPEELS